MLECVQQFLYLLTYCSMYLFSGTPFDSDYMKLTVELLDTDKSQMKCQDAEVPQFERLTLYVPERTE